MRVLLSAYDCDPVGGAEARLGWSFATHLADAGHDVLVLTNTRNQAELRAAQNEDQRPNLQVHWVQDHPLLRFHPRPRYKAIYALWQYQALRDARRLDQTFDCDLVHHLGWASLSGGSQLGRLGKPFVFGPIGGGQTTPVAFKSYLGAEWRREWIRSLTRVKALRLVPAARAAVRRADLVIAANEETVGSLESLGASRVKLMTDVAIPESLIVDDVQMPAPDEPITVVWLARNFPFKGLLLALDVFARVPRSVPAHFVVIGADRSDPTVAAKVRELELGDRVELAGVLPWPEAQKRLRAADVFLFTSLRDTSGVQVGEALAGGLAVLSLNHQGVRLLVDERYGLLAPVVEPAETIAVLAGAIEQLATDRTLLEQKRRAAVEAARNMTWTRHVERIIGCYREVLAAGT